MTRVSNVNATSLRAAIELACQTMHSVFNADDNDIPFFIASVHPKVEFAFNDSFSEAHVPGRHLNALLAAEAIAGVQVDESAIERLANAAFFSFGGVLPLPLNRDRIGGTLNRFLTHNVREGLHALYALIAYRNSDRARNLMQRCVETIGALWNPERGWDAAPFAAADVQLIEWPYPAQSPFVTGIARAIGPLVKIYRVTGYEPALELAQSIAGVATDSYLLPSGDYSVELFGGHVHSTTCTLSGLAQLADTTGDKALMERVLAFYQNGLKQISDPIGWSIENAHATANPDRGEANNSGDILETALILARHGHRSGYEEAERILRCHMLPSQVRDVSFIINPPNPNGEDRLHRVAERHLGAFGFPAPYGHWPIDAEWVGFNLDIVGGATASICEALRATATFRDGSHQINMLFDYESEHLKVESPYTGEGLRVTCKSAAPLWVRLPSWVDTMDVRVHSDADSAVFHQERFVFVPEPLVNEPISIDFDLAPREIVLPHRTRDIRVALRGESVERMDDFGAEWTFFPPYEP